MHKRLNTANGSCAMKIGEGKSRATSAPLVGFSIMERVYHTIITAQTVEQKWTEVTMRDIEFRGRRTDNGEWVYGNLVRGCDEQYAYIVEFGNKELCRNYVDIDPETVGQYTGLKDENGKKIFEGDIVKCVDANNGGSFSAIVSFGNPNYEYNWGFQLFQMGGDNLNTDILLWVDMEEAGAYIEVISNIYDSAKIIGGNNNGRVEDI